MKKMGMLSLLFCVLSCRDRTILDNVDLSQSKIEVIRQGDVSSYLRLTNFYDKENNYYEILPYSLKMMGSNKIGYGDFFKTYMKIKFNDTLNNIQKLDKEEQDFLIYILKKGVVNDDFECRNLLSEFYRKGIGVKKDTRKADSLLTIQ